MIRASWIDNGSDPDYTRLARAGITVPYFDPRDPRVTAGYLDSVASHPEIDTCGLYFAWNWYPFDGRRFAEKVHSELLRIRWQGNPAVCLNDESHDPVRIRTLLRRYRELRPKRDAWWTFEGMQGGWIGAAGLGGELARLGIRAAPQFYAGDMSPLGHSVVLDLLMAGVDGTIVDGMYDAAALPYRWRGFAFTQGRLPA